METDGAALTGVDCERQSDGYTVDGEVGVISDTHGVVRPQALEALAGCALILHAGDIGQGEVIEQLRAQAQLIAIRGNIDKGEWGQHLPSTDAFQINGKRIYLIHNIKELAIDPTGSFDAVVFGHSHQPHNQFQDGVLYFNPGSAGPRRFSLPVCVGRLSIGARGVVAKIVELAI